MKSASIKIFPSSKLGPVKPVNGVGQPPILGVGSDSLFHYLTDAGIPFSRLHDTGGSFGKNLYVDIPNLFPEALPFSLDLGGAAPVRVRLTDETRTWDDVPLPAALPPHSFLVASSNL